MPKEGPIKKPNINDKITANQVRVIGAEGEQLGIMPIFQALRLCQEQGFDLVEVAPDAKPPVCRIMDYGKYRYQQEKRQHEGRKNQATVTLKEIKVRPKTGVHDYQTKLKHVREFLAKGHKVKVTVMFRGREIVHADLGQAHLTRMTQDVEDLGQVEFSARMEGRTMHMILAPKAKKS